MTSDQERTSFEEISWRISKTSYEFVPYGVKTKKSDLNTTILAIEKKDLPQKPFEVMVGEGTIEVNKNKFQDKEFNIDAKTPMIFRLNTFNFPGWTAYLNNKKIEIIDKNNLKLITVNIPTGKNKLKFAFKDTIVRNIASLITLISVITLILFHLKQFKKVDG